ncbi:MAG: VWA domain-containing protein [Candidatus Aenigmarchaeota archaeon]|nr:VWA domain-containing protein [Candidatus Aenigmarchaeota archaeon]
MQITFSYENINLMILLIGVTIILHLITLRARKKRVVKFSNFETLQRVVGKKMFQNDYIILLLRILGVTCIILGLSNFTIITTGNISNFDFVLAIDTSSSMSTADFIPNRLEAAKDASLYLLDIIPKGTRVGVVTFAGKPYKKIGLSTDLEKVKNVVENINFEAPAGTAISDALLMAGTIASESNRSKAIILLTDGKNNRGVSINESLKFVKKNNITVYTIGIGTNMTINLTQLNLSKTLGKELSEGTLAEFPDLDIKTLKQISNVTGGRFFLASNRTSLRSAYEKTVIEAKLKRLNLSYYLFLLGIIFFLTEWALGATKYKTIP